MDLKILNSNLVFQGIIDNFQSLIFTRNFFQSGKFELKINKNKPNASLLAKDNIVMLSPNKAGIIKYIKITVDEIHVVGFELSCLLGKRIVIPPDGEAYDTLNTDGETVIKTLIEHNVTAPTDSNRTISLIQLATNQNRGNTIKVNGRYQKLDELIAQIATLSGLGLTYEIDTNTPAITFDVFEGVNRSYGVNENAVVFSNKLDNITFVEYIADYLQSKNLAYTAGQGEGAARTIVTLPSSSIPTGLNRDEMFIDARDLSLTADLEARGENALIEAEPRVTFDQQINPLKPFKYETDYNLGDIATVRNDEYEVIGDYRIVEATETYENGEGFRVDIVVGSKPITVFDLIKKEISNINVVQ